MNALIAVIALVLLLLTGTTTAARPQLKRTYGGHLVTDKSFIVCEVEKTYPEPVYDLRIKLIHPPTTLLEMIGFTGYQQIWFEPGERGIVTRKGVEKTGAFIRILSKSMQHGQRFQVCIIHSARTKRSGVVVPVLCTTEQFQYLDKENLIDDWFDERIYGVRSRLVTPTLLSDHHPDKKFRSAYNVAVVEQEIAANLTEYNPMRDVCPAPVRYELEWSRKFPGPPIFKIPQHEWIPLYRYKVVNRLLDETIGDFTSRDREGNRAPMIPLFRDDISYFYRAVDLRHRKNIVIRVYNNIKTYRQDALLFGKTFEMYGESGESAVQVPLTWFGFPDKIANGTFTGYAVYRYGHLSKNLVTLEQVLLERLALEKRFSTEEILMYAYLKLLQVYDLLRVGKKLLKTVAAIEKLGHIHNGISLKTIWLLRPDVEEDWSSLHLKMTDHSCSLDEISFCDKNLTEYETAYTHFVGKKSPRDDVWAVAMVMAEMISQKKQLNMTEPQQLFNSFVKLIGVPPYDMREYLTEYLENDSENGLAMIVYDPDGPPRSTVLSRLSTLPHTLIADYRHCFTSCETGEHNLKFDPQTQKIEDIIKASFKWNATEIPTATKLLQMFF